MKLFGLTGGIGMGKSTSGRLLSKRGIPVIDTDVLARQIVEPGQPALNEIKNLFGRKIIDADGQLLREQLARIVFSDKAALRNLENILHPRIRELWQAEVEHWHVLGHKWGVVIIPLLFETNAESGFDNIICVACSAATQLQRLREREWSDEQIDQRLGSQWPVEMKITQSDLVIWTDTTLEIHASQIDRILATE